MYLTDSVGKALFAPGSIVYDRTRTEASERHFVPREVTARVRMLSLRPINAVEIVVNGRAERMALAAEAGETSAYRGSRRLRLDTSAWIAARWTEGGDIAHSSPIYYRVPGKPIPVPRRQAEYFASRVEKLIAEVTAGKTASGARPGITLEPAGVQEKTVARFTEALAVYRAKLEGAR